MTIFSIHSKAAQIACAGVCVSLALFAVGVMAQAAPTPFIDTYYADRLVKQFQKPGSAYHYANTSIESSAFDFQAYNRHTCFIPTENDKPMCADQFGPYALLRQTLVSGKLYDILKFYHLGSESIATTVVNQVTARDARLARVNAPSPEEEYRSTIELRGSSVWQACKRAYGSDPRQLNPCFQRNLRLISLLDVPLQGNAY